MFSTCLHLEVQQSVHETLMDELFSEILLNPAWSSPILVDLKQFTAVPMDKPLAQEKQTKEL